LQNKLKFPTTIRRQANVQMIRKCKSRRQAGPDAAAAPNFIMSEEDKNYDLAYYSWISE